MISLRHNLISEKWERHWYHKPGVRFDWTLHNNEWVYDTNVMMTKQETRVGDSERPFFLSRNRHNRVMAFILSFLKHIGQRWRRKKRSVWDRRHPIASSCCIPHTRGNIPAALHHGGKVEDRQCWRHADLLLDRAAVLELLGLWVWFICVDQILEKRHDRIKSEQVETHKPVLTKTLVVTEYFAVSSCPV